jgi:hypothetical protein
MRRRDVFIAAALFLVTLVVVVATIDHYGLTYDEPIYAGLGQREAAWIGLALRGEAGAFDREAIAAYWSAKDQQPPFAKVLSGISLSAFPFLSESQATRLPTAIFFALTVALLYLFCRPATGRSGALAGALALLTMPRVFADAHYTTLDIPMAATTVFTVIAGYRAARENRWPPAIGFGVLFGLALLTKINALFLPVIVLGWAIAFHRRALPKLIVAMVVIGPLVFLAGWPLMWHDTGYHLGEYLRFQLQHYPVATYYLGSRYDYAPWHYPIVMIAATVPALLLLTAVAGVARAARHPGRDRVLLWAAAFIIPLAASSMPFAPKYNGVRLFMPVFPFLACFVAIGFQWGVEAINRFSAHRRWRVYLTTALGLVMLLPGAIGVATTHPFQLAYYNAFVGGPRGAKAKGFETIYWGGVYLNALHRLEALPGRSPLIYVTPQGCISLLEVYRDAGAIRADLRYTSDPARVHEADLVIFQCAQGEFDAVSWPLYRDGKPTWQIALKPGVPLFLAFDRAEVARVLAAEGAASLLK